MDEQELSDKGYTQEEIAKMFGLTREHVKWVIENYSEEPTDD